MYFYFQVYNSMEELKALGNLNTEYPLSQMTICVGFFFVYFSEELSHWFITKLPDEPCSTHLKKITPSVTPLEETSDKVKTKAFIIDEEYEKTKDNEVKSIRELKEDVLSIDENHENIVYDSLSLNSEVEKENEKNLQLNKEAERNVEEAVQYEIKTQQQLMRWVFVVLALSMHAIFEGLAIGLQNSKADIWYLFIAVSVHSATILFCMGLELLLARTKTRFIFVQMLILALSSPVGVTLGLLFTIKINMEPKAKSTAVVLLEGFSAGAILYITFFEVLNREKERRVYRLYRAVCILGGFGLMAFLQYLEFYHYEK